MQTTGFGRACLDSHLLRNLFFKKVSGKLTLKTTIRNINFPSVILFILYVFLINNNEKAFIGPFYHASVMCEVTNMHYFTLSLSSLEVGYNYYFHITYKKTEACPTTSSCQNLIFISGLTQNSPFFNLFLISLCLYDFFFLFF